MSNTHTVLELVNTESRIQQLADMGLAYSTIKIDPATEIPQTLINLRREYRNSINHDSGQDANQKTVDMNQHSALKSAIYINSDLLEYPHFLRLVWCDETKQVFCSYYADDAKCMVDIRTKKKAVSFLNEYIPRATEFDPQYWRDIVAAQTSALSFDPANEGWQIKSTNDIELGVSIYGHNELCKGGGDSVSCMATSTKGSLWHRELDTNRQVHPIYAYLESPDVRLCYITDKEGHYIARWIAPIGADKYTAIYSTNKNYQHVITMLHFNGWIKCDESLKGCRLAVITTNEGKVLMPYIDSYTNHLDIDNQSCGLAFLTGRTGYDCDHSTGTASGYNDSALCECCGDSIRGDSVFIESTDETVCECCANDRYTYANTGRRGDMYVSNDRNIYYHNGEYYTTSGLDWHDLVVLHDGDVADRADVCEVDGDYYYVNDCSYCPITGEYFLSSEGRTIEGVEADVSPDAYSNHATCGQFDILYHMGRDNILSLADVLDSIRSIMEDTDVLNEDSIKAQYNTIVNDLTGSTDEDTTEGEVAA